MFVLYGLFSLPQGWIAQRVGRKALMTVFFLGTGASLAACAFASSAVDAGRRARRRRIVRRDLPPDRHRHAGGGRGRHARPRHRRQRRVRQSRRGAGAGRHRRSWPTRSAGARPSSCRAWSAPRSAWCGCACPAHDAHGAALARPFPPIPRHLVRRAVIVLLLIADRLRPGVQRLHPAAAEADAGAAGRAARACCRWSAPPRSSPRCAAR